MGNVTSNGVGSGGGKSFRRQQKQQQPMATPLAYSQQAPQRLPYQPTRFKANKRNKYNNLNNNNVRRQQLATSQHFPPLGRASSRSDIEQQHLSQRQDIRNWSPETPTTSPHYLDNQLHHRSRAAPNYQQQHRLANYHLDDIYNHQPLRLPHTQHNQPAAISREYLVSPAASYELIGHSNGNSTPPSSSSTAAAGHPLDQYDRVAYLNHHQHQHNLNHHQHPHYHHQLDHYSASYAHHSAGNYHQNPLVAYDDCELMPESSAFNESHLAGLHITQPPAHCLDACCNPDGAATATTTTAPSSQSTTRARRIGSPTQQARRQAGAQRRTQNGTIVNESDRCCNNSQSANSMAATRLATATERGLALTESERIERGLLGLLPGAVQDQELQSRAVMSYIDQCQDELAKYVYLRNVKDFNENLFYYTLTRNVEKLMPIVYTPVVGLACQQFSQIYLRPRGLFVTARDGGRVAQVLANWPERDVRAIVMTDGERILGLGDLGANGMGICIGKLSLYTALAGIAPRNVMPVTIDVGTNNEALLADPLYIGLRQRRIRGDKYDALVDEFMQACVKRWGRSCLIQFEDFANSTAFNLLERHRRQYCTFNDDIQGTASVSLSGLITAARLIGKRLSDCSCLFYGAGEANLGTASLLIMAMCDEGLTRDEAKKRIWLVDSKGLVVLARDDLNEHKRQLAQDAEHLKDLEDIIDLVKPAAIVGASAQGGSFTEPICNKMAKHNERPIIFALSNPTSKAECTADQAYQWTGGRCVFASGSPFEPVKYGEQTYVTGQGNNAYIFPGVGLAAIAAHTHVVPEEVFLVAARALSDQVTEQDSDVGLVYPSLAKIREVTLKVATRVLEYLYAERLATYRPEPSDKQAFLKSIQYDPSY